MWIIKQIEKKNRGEKNKQTNKQTKSNCSYTFFDYFSLTGADIVQCIVEVVPGTTSPVCPQVDGSLFLAVLRSSPYTRYYPFVTNVTTGRDATMPTG